MDEFLEQFLTESRELVEQATADLLALEQSPDDRDRLDSGFRAFHTLKGAADDNVSWLLGTWRAWT